MRFLTRPGTAQPHPPGAGRRLFAAFAAAAAAIAILCGAWRFEQFGHTDLTSDQAFFTQWIIRLADADHLLPRGDGSGSLAQALMHDEGSALNILLRQIYQAQTQLFTVVSVAIFAISALVVGASMKGVIAISIAAGTVALWLLALFPLLCRPPAARAIPFRESCAVGALSLLGGCTCSFLNVFSAMGPHNTGVMFLLAAAIATQRWLGRAAATGRPFADRRATILMFAAQGLAIYAHYTNVFLVAPATLVAILADPAFRLNRRLRTAALFGALAFLVFVPAIALIALYGEGSGGAGNNQTFAGIAENFVMARGNPAVDTVGERAALWFSDVASFYSVPGLLLGLAGVAGLAWRDRLIYPAAIVAVHFLFGAFMLSFGQYDRTAAYLVPMLILGGAWSVVAALRFLSARRNVAAGLTALLVLCAAGLHAAGEFPRLADPASVRSWGRMIGQSHWRTAIAGIEATIPPGGVLIPWDYGLSHQFMSMSGRARRDIRVFRPLETLMTQADAGALRGYLDVRGLTASMSVAPGQPVYVLAPADMAPEVLNRDLLRLFGPGGLALPIAPLAVLPRLAWHMPPGIYVKSDLRLYEAVPRGGATAQSAADPASLTRGVSPVRP